MSDEKMCAHEGCTCKIGPEATWCSDQCRDAQQGYANLPHTMCMCNHADCTRSGAG